ncbi:MAG: PfkB family carbohydrate kinase [Solirubrobacteraceae bacterium]
MNRVAVIGHVEWVDFLRVEHLPIRGEVQGAKREARHAGGGAVVAAVALTELGAEVDFFCAVGRDDNGDAAVAELTDRGVTVHAARRAAPTRQVFTLLDRDGERTIITIGERLAPAGGDDLDWGRLAQIDGVYLTAGDADAVRRGRDARVLVATPRIREGLDDPNTKLDALVFSASDEHEVQWAQRLADQTRLMVATESERGGHWCGESEGRWSAATPSGPIRDSYGCGDAFAAGFTYGLAGGLPPGRAAEIGARCGADMLTRVGAP